MKIYSFIIIFTSIIKLMSSSNITRSFENDIKNFGHHGRQLLKNSEWVHLDFVPKEMTISFKDEINFNGNKKNVFVESISFENVSDVKLRTTEFGDGIEIVEYLATNITLTTVLRSKELRCDKYVNATTVNVNVLGRIEFEISQNDGNVTIEESHRFSMKDLNVLVKSKFDKSCNYDMLEDTNMWNSIFKTIFNGFFAKMVTERLTTISNDPSKEFRIDRQFKPKKLNQRNQIIISNTVIDEFLKALNLVISNKYSIQMSIPDLNTSFNFNIIINIPTNIKAKKGSIHDLSSIYRTGRWRASVSNNVLKLRGAIGFRKLVIHYGECTTKIGPITKSGYANIVLDKNSFYFQINVLFNGNNTEIDIKALNVLKWSIKKVKFSNLGLLNRVIISHFNNFMGEQESQGVYEFAEMLRRKFEDVLREYFRS